jgi:hypothetical protein
MLAEQTRSPNAYPVRFEVDYPDHLSRLLIFVKWLLAIPHWIILIALAIAMYVVNFIAFFAILFTKKYPEGLFRFAVGVDRWSYNVSVYTGLLRDEYPPFSMEGGAYPLAYDVEYPGEMSRWLIFIKWLLILPNAIVFLLVAIASYFTTFIAWFMILFTGSYPRGLFNFYVGVLRWGARINAYTGFMTDRYPPFGLS